MKKVFAKALAFAMAVLCLTASASASTAGAQAATVRTGGEVLWNNNGDEVSAVDLAVTDVATAEGVTGVVLPEGPQARKVVSLSPGHSAKFDRTYYEKGTVIDIFANWDEPSVDLKLGVYSVDIDDDISATISGGEGAVQVTINKSGYFYIYAENIFSSKTTRATISYAY